MSSNKYSKWNLEMLVVEDRGTPAYPEKNLLEQSTDNQQQTQPTYDAGSRNRNRNTLVKGGPSILCAIPAPYNIVERNWDHCN